MLAVLILKKNQGGQCKEPASVNRLTEAGTFPAAVMSRLTVTIASRRARLPASENKKRPPRKNFLQ